MLVLGWEDDDDLHSTCGLEPMENLSLLFLSILFLKFADIARLVTFTCKKNYGLDVGLIY